MLDATRLLVQAERCFRLARGAAGPRLADELEALGRAFEQEAMGYEVVERWHHTQSNAELSPADTARGKADQ
jgi:hypothetical protein